MDAMKISRFVNYILPSALVFGDYLTTKKKIIARKH